MFLCYGRHTNLGLLEHYGFVLASNPHDTAPLAPQLLPAAVQRQLAANGGGSSNGGMERAAEAAAYLHASGAPSWELLRALRMGCATSAERKTRAHLALADQPISASSERAAFVVLRKACGAALAALPTSIEQDEEQLAALQAAAPGLPAAEQQPEAQQQQQQQLQQEQLGSAGQQDAARDGLAQAQDGAAVSPQHLERMQVVVKWRLLHKRILQRGIALCDALLAALGTLPGAAPPDVGPQVAALCRTPRW